ncbi:MAG TPA: translation initiation factor IF-2 [Deltaproteobacteria bacterium]|nr:translation initiation factor IF-2 [Deltaproteobacteria bacterium]
MDDEKTSKTRQEKPSAKKKGKKKTVIDDSPSDDGFKRRKKEVYERSDLYGGRSKKTKGKAKGGKKGGEVVRKLKQTEITTPKALKRKIRVQEFVTIMELAKAMGVKAPDLIKRLIALGTMVNITQAIDFDTASVVADVLGFELELDTFKEGDYFTGTEDRAEDLLPRPPVVTIMGHVDHGKTSLLDFIRNSNIIGGESGGITQHIGAYYVTMDRGDIVFLDTPGHAAFTAMRARGAKITDLIVLVVAADDGVMPQTKEAINHAKAAGIPIVVAVNKMDKPDADPEKVKRELAELNLSPEEWGGETLYGHISAKTGEGVEGLLGLISLQAEMLELRGNPNKEASGTVIEAELDKSKGPVATVLIKAGTLHKGDHFVCGEFFGRVRAMLDHRGKRVLEATPSVPVALYGISGVPMAGDNFIVVKDEKTAKQIMEHRKEKSKTPDSGKKGLVSLDDLFERIREGGVKELNIVLKADVQGSAEALSESLTKQSTDAVKLHVIHSATGAIAESDVMLAAASGAIIIGFNVRANPRVAALAEKEKVDIRYYDVIYNAINDIRLAMVGLLEPLLQERVVGHANIKEIFKVPKVGAIAGCQVTDGKIDRKAKIRLLRDDVVVFDGKIASLRRFKEDAKEVMSGYECGIGLENFNDVKPGDIFEVYEVDEVAAEL